MTQISPPNRLPADLEPASEPHPRLRLRKLIVHGFKSFADRTEFVFDRPIVGVVGPNGCGKSNVVDAVKWVLGEQSAKSLRGEAMLDVIFNGAAGRSPGNSAEVTLVFDNPRRPDGSRPLPSDADEVSVGRLLLRDGTSHYKLNGANARLKDVRDLFLDTGIGVDAYSVIEQGRVAQMLDASSTERRTIFEEAAGISRFKLKKKEAQRKLERTEQNLLRLGDIVEEVERRLRSVKLAAGKARSYQELTAELAELRLRSALHDFHTLSVRQSEQTAAREQAAFERDDVQGELQRAQNKLAGKRQEADDAADASRQAEYRLVQARSRAEQSRQKIEYARREAEQVQQQGAALRDDDARAREQRQENAAALERDRAELARCTGALEEALRRIDQRHAAHREAQLSANEAARLVDAHKSAALEALNRIAAADRRLASIEIERHNAGDRAGKLTARRAQIEADRSAAVARRDEHLARIEDLARQLAQEEASLESRRDQSRELGEALGRLGEQLVAAREGRSALVSRQKVLQDLEARREGVGEGVQQVLRDRATRFGFVRGLVADVLRVDVEHAPVIEAALDGRDQWLVAEEATGDEQLLAVRQSLADLAGRVNVLRRGGSGLDEAPTARDAFEQATADDRAGDDLPVDPSAGSAAPGRNFLASLATSLTADRFDWRRWDVPIRLAVDLVQYDPADAGLAELLLGRTVVVETLEQALMLVREGPPGLRYVTQAGEVVESDGTLRTGPLGAAMGILSRRSELSAVRQHVAEADARIASLHAEVARGNEQRAEIERELAERRDRVYDLRAAKVEAGEKLSSEQDRVAGLERELPAVEAELAELAGSLEGLESEERSLQEKREEEDARRSGLERSAEEAQQQRQALEERIAVLAEELTKARVEVGQVQEQQIAARRSVERHEARDGELSQQIERIGAVLAGLEERRAAAEADAQRAEQEQRRLEAEGAELGRQVEELSARAEALRAEAHEWSERVEDLRMRQESAEDRVREADVRLNEVNVRLETLVARAAEEAQLDLPARYAAAGEQGGYDPGEEDWDAIAGRIRDLRDRIHRLGNVNIDSIAEQEQLEARQQQLADQVADLTGGKQQLEELIETINRESGERFEQTFNAVRDHFQTMFRKLFGGGKADIFLQTEVEERIRDEEGNVSRVMKTLDVLEAGIEIVARPPGKQPVTISQLSGGEKTMTCVALLMSLFRSKPSPFCILDEVDAALDEANNVRFNRILEEFLGDSQFIVITHSKRTMQVVDVLYGVTMQEQGVSKKVAVRFDQVAEGGRIHAEAAA